MTDEKDAEIAALKARLEALERAAQPASAPSEPASKLAEPTSDSPTEKRTVLLWVVGLVVFCILLIGYCSSQPPVSQQAEVRPLEETEGVAVPDVPAEPEPVWDYSDTRDPMTDELTRTACTTSSNQAYLSSPYNPVNARLCIRDSPRHGVDVYVHLLGDGQIICRSYRDCTVPVRFGEGEQQQFSAGESADGSSNVIFITNTGRFIAGAQEAAVTRIQPMFYRDGEQVLEFPTADLEWPRPAPMEEP